MTDTIHIFRYRLAVRPSRTGVLIGLFWILIPPVWCSGAEEPVRLEEAFPPGYQYHVSCRVDISGALSLPLEKGETKARTLPVTGQSAIEYDERVLERSASGQVQKTIRIYRRINFERKVGGRPQENTIRPGVRRLVVLRHRNIEVPFSPDGPLLWGEMDLVRTDVFTPALTGLLPDQAVRTGARWKAGVAAIQELTDMDRIKEGTVQCRFEQLTTLGNRPHARVTFSGTVTGTNEDGPNRQQLDGYFFFDLRTRYLSYLYLKGTQFMLDRAGKVQGKIVGHFTLTRQPGLRSRDLTDQALRGVALQPNDDNTLMLYDNTDLGVRFLYPRRWRVAGVHGRQVALDEARGNGLLLTLEPPQRVPTADQFLNEARTWLAKQKGRLFRLDRPRRLQNPPVTLDRFTLDAEVARQRAVLDYYVVRQVPGGATITARLLPADLTRARREAERIARSVRITRTIAAEQPRK
jgi:hypothetical protein